MRKLQIELQSLRLGIASVQISRQNFANSSPPESLGMNVTTKPLDALLPVSSLGNSVPKAPSIQGGGFLDAMKQALSTTSQLQSESGRLSREVTFGNPTVSLEETMLAGVKSNIAFQATLQSRNRIVQAYTDVMNMQV